MLKTKSGLLFVIALMLLGCSNKNQQEQTESSEQIQIVIETDSLSSDLSNASDSIDKKVNDLESTLNNLNN